MAIFQLSATQQASVNTSSSRFSNANTVAETIATAQAKARALFLLSVQDFVDRVTVEKVVPIAMASANVLNGANGNGRAHINVDTNLAVATPAEIEAFCASLVALPTKDAVEQAFYAFRDTHGVQAVVWDNEPMWAQRGNAGTVSGVLRISTDATGVTRGTIGNLVPEKPSKVIVAQRGGLTTALPVGSATPVIPMRIFNGVPTAESALLAMGLPQTMVDTLPQA